MDICSGGLSTVISITTSLSSSHLRGGNRGSCVTDNAASVIACCKGIIG